MTLNRRNFLLGLGVLTGGTALGQYAPIDAQASTIPPGRGYESLPNIDGGWRMALAAQYHDRPHELYARPLQDGIEIWEKSSAGYMIVDESSRTVLESATRTSSPYRGIGGNISYLGPGQYYTTGVERGVNIYTGNLVAKRELNAISIDAAEQIQDSLTRSTPAVTTASKQHNGSLQPVKSSSIKSRVSGWSYITNSTVYENTSRTCGWIAGSIITRYWHACSRIPNLLPIEFRSGTNMTLKPNFATYLQNGKANGTWARTVKDQLIWNAKNQKVNHTSAWALGNIGMWNELNAGRPFILFGSIPVTSSGSVDAHAVVVYGQTNGGDLIAHYGWANHTAIILNAGLVGSNTKFRLT